MFVRGFVKKAMEEVAKAAIFRNGKYLMGVRQDNGKWTEPGGHLNKGEDPLSGVVREVKEETGMTIPAKDFLLMGHKDVKPPDKKEPIRVWAFRVDLDKDKKMVTDKDPDDEVFGWNWVMVKNNKLPKIVDNNLHVPSDKNVLHYFLGFQKSLRENK